MDLIYQNILQQIDISKEDFSSFSKLLEVQTLKKNTFFAEQNKKANYLAFIVEGAMYSYSVNDKGEKQVVQIALKNNWISDPYSFLSNNTALYNVQAITETKVYLLSKDNFEKACNEISNFERFFRILIQNAYINSLQRISGIYSESAEERYKNIVKSNPEMIQNIPQHYIASFLGIKPQSLSRIRKSIIS